MQDLIKSILPELLGKLNLSFTDIRVDDADDTMIRVDIDSTDASRLIGWHGETINSIQHLLKALIRSQKKLERSPFIVLDVDGYRKAQEEKVCRIAEQKVDFVRRKKTRIALPPMSPYFRRIVHLFVANHPSMQDILTESIGDGEYRQIVLRLKEGSMDEGEELVPSIEAGDDKETKDAFENLDV